MKKTVKAFLLLLIALFIASLACNTTDEIGSTNEFTLVADSAVQPFLGNDCNSGGILGEFQKESGICVKTKYVSSVDENILAKQATTPDKSNQKDADKTKPTPTPIPGPNPTGANAFLAVDGAWLNANLKNPMKIAESNIVFGVDQDQAEKIGWQPGSKHQIQEVLNLMDEGKLKPVICNANRCPTGALFFSAVISSLKGKPGSVLNIDDVNNPEVMAKGKDFYSRVKTADTESDALASYIRGGSDSFVTLEANAVTINNQLTQAGIKPLIWFYLTDAGIVASPTLACMPDESNLDKCGKLQSFLTKEKTQIAIATTGWRSAIFGVSPATSLNQYGLEIEPDLAYVPSPNVDVMDAFITQYALAYKLPTQMVICGDDSGSMFTNAGKDQFNQAITNVFDDNWTKLHQIPIGPKDETTVFLFSGGVSNVGTIVGNDPADLTNFANTVKNAATNHNSTAIYDCGITALDYFKNNPRPGYNRVLIIMTDGDNKTGNSKNQFIQTYKDSGLADLSIISIAFGFDANDLKDDVFGKYVNGTYFRGDDLVAAFEKVRGGN